MGVSTQKFSSFINDIRELYDEMNYFRNFKKAIENVIFAIDIMEKNKVPMSFSYCDIFAIFYVILVRDVLLNKESIIKFLESFDIISNFTNSEIKKIHEIIEITQQPINYKNLKNNGIDKNTFIRLLLKLSEDSYYFKEYSINYTWILLYYQQYQDETNLYINKMQKNYIEQTILPLFDFFCKNNILGLSEYKKNLEKNLDFWKTAKNVTRHEFINGVF